MRVRVLTIVLAVQLVIGGALIALVLSGALGGGDDGGGGGDGRAAARAPDRFDARRAFALVREQVELGPRPAGSRASRGLARRLRRLLPAGRYQRVPGGLRNVVGRVEGRDPGRYVVVGAHYDTKDGIPGFVGANDGASGTAVAVELARAVRRSRAGPAVVFVLFDGEESPAGTADVDFEREGLRGSRVAARRYGDAEAAIAIDFVGDRTLSLPREANSDPELWERLRAAARRVGKGRFFPPRTRPAILDDHIPFLRAGVPAIDLIDFDFACFHDPCDDLSQVSPRSLDAAGETVLELLRTL